MPDEKIRRARVTKKFHMDSSHFLPGYPGECGNLHGHRWTIEVSFFGPIDSETGMVLDFKVVKFVVDPIIKRLDHSHLNETLAMPTAENIAHYLRDEIGAAVNVIGNFPKDVALDIVRVWETPDACAEVF